jgi:hypothetical protein
MDDRLYDVQTDVNIYNKAKKSMLEEDGVDTSSTEAQQAVYNRMPNPGTNSVIVIYDLSSVLIGGRQKGGPNKKRENHLVLLMKMSTKKPQRKSLYLSESTQWMIIMKHVVMHCTYQTQMI